jgi:hypothetical protein
VVTKRAPSTSSASVGLELEDNHKQEKVKIKLKVFKQNKRKQTVQEPHDIRNLQNYNHIRPGGRERQASANLIDWSQMGEFASRSTGLSTFYGIPTYDANSDPALRFIDPYDDVYKGRLINCFLFDPIVNEAIRVRVSHLLGSATSINFYPDTGVIYDSQQAAQTALTAVISDIEQKSLRDFIFKVESKICRLREHLYPAVIQSFVGGRSALYYELAKKNNAYGVPELCPVAIKPLHFSYLGQVKVDVNTWELDSVEYKDTVFESQKTQDQLDKGLNYYIPANRLIYLPREDEHMTPNDYLYGKSVIQPILSMSETLRFIIEEDLPEINKSQWAGSGFFEFTGMDNDDIQAVLDDIEPGINIGFNQPVKYTNIPAQGNVQALTSQLTEILQFMLIKLKVPTYLMNREQITNRATTETISQIWQITTLEQDRDWLREQLQRQWYDPLIELKTGIRAFDLKYKIVLEFQQKVFSDILSKAQAIVLLLNALVISRIEGREMLGLGPLDESVQGLGSLNPLDQKAVNDALAKINTAATNQVQAANNNVSGLDVQKELASTNPVKKAKTLNQLRLATAAISKQAPPIPPIGALTPTGKKKVSTSSGTATVA